MEEGLNVNVPRHSRIPGGRGGVKFSTTIQIIYVTKKKN